MQLYTISKIIILLYRDNQKAIALISNLKYYQHTKYIDVRYY